MTRNKSKQLGRILPPCAQKLESLEFSGHLLVKNVGFMFMRQDEISVGALWSSLTSLTLRNLKVTPDTSFFTVLVPRLRKLVVLAFDDSASDVVSPLLPKEVADLDLPDARLKRKYLPYLAIAYFGTQLLDMAFVAVLDTSAVKKLLQMRKTLRGIVLRLNSFPGIMVDELFQVLAKYGPNLRFVAIEHEGSFT
eukprot:Colp12_sorted_trinity150504_noHs@569